MKIKAKHRMWDLETTIEDDCLKIDELHEDAGTLDIPHIHVPIESIDELVFQLLKFKRKEKK